MSHANEFWEITGHAYDAEFGEDGWGEIINRTRWELREVRYPIVNVYENYEALKGPR